jgi:hypothetical protein
MTFACFILDRFDYLLHFHLEAHARCEVKLKPNLWEKGAYFRPELLQDDTLRLIPHFITIPLREDAPRKRQLPTPDAGEEVVMMSQPQKRRMEVVEANATHETTPKSGDDSSDTDDIPRNQNSSTTLKTQAHPNYRRYDHGFFKPKAVAPLPREATHTNWVINFAKAKQNYLDFHPLAKDTTSKYTNYAAHTHMINGRYGTAALISCTQCTTAGVPCRVYHPDRYEWQTPGQSMFNVLG